MPIGTSGLSRLLPVPQAGVPLGRGEVARYMPMGDPLPSALRTAQLPRHPQDSPQGIRQTGAHSCPLAPPMFSPLGGGGARRTGAPALHTARPSGL